MRKTGDDRKVEIDENSTRKVQQRVDDKEEVRIDEVQEDMQMRKLTFMQPRMREEVEDKIKRFD